MASAESILNANLRVSTRKLWKRTEKRQVYMATPLHARLMLANRQTFRGGTSINAPLDMAEMDDLAQAYTMEDALTAGTDTMLDDARFTLRFFQVPISYDARMKMANFTGKDMDTRVLNFSKFLVKKAQRAARIKLYKMMYGIGAGSAALASSDAEVTNPAFQSVIQALTHDLQYGNITRTISTATATFWQGGSISGAFTDNATARSASIGNFRAFVDAIMPYADGPKDLIFVSGPVIWRKLQQQVEGKQSTPQKGLLAKYGFTTQFIDEIECVLDYWLVNARLSNAHKYAFMFNIADWELWLHNRRNFKMLPFTHQARFEGGKDRWLSRVMVAGNLCCFKPNGSIWNSAWT